MISKIRVSVLICLLLIPLWSLTAVEPFRVAGTTNADRLRVRQEPSLTGAQTGSLAVGTNLEIVDVTPDEMVIGTMSARWYKIRSLPGGDGVEGWSYGFFIDVAPEDLLALAIWAGHPFLVQELIASGTNVNARLEEDGLVFSEYDEYSYTSSPVMEAVLSGSSEVVEMLIAAGASPDAGFVKGEPGGTLRSNALVTAVQRGDSAIVHALVDGGADLEIEMRSFGGGGDGFNMTPLTAAVVAGETALGEYLVAAGADVNHAVKYWATFGDGDTWKSPLDVASENGRMELYFAIEAAGGRPARAE